MHGLLYWLIVNVSFYNHEFKLLSVELQPLHKISLISFQQYRGFDLSINNSSNIYITSALINGDLDKLKSLDSVRSQIHAYIFF